MTDETPNDNGNDRIADRYLILALAERVRGQRQRELAALRCEKALLRYYTSMGKCKDQVEEPGERGMTMKEAIHEVVNGQPKDNFQVFAEVKERFPQVKASYKTCRDYLCDMTKLGYFNARRSCSGMHRRCLYTKAS